MKGIRRKAWFSFLLAGLAIAVIGISVVAAGSAHVTSGDFHTYAAGVERGYDISGRAQMVRTADGRTLVRVEAWGLAPDTAYPSQ
jgi:hypothetical protein